MLSRTTRCLSNSTSSLTHKFDVSFNNDRRLQQRLRICKVDEVISTYSQFMPRLARWMDELGFRRHLTMPSRAFCSDETQGCPTIQIKRQFGVFPFDHGVVGGLLAADRHGPHSHHGEDMLIVQASHVGYDEQTRAYGAVRRIKTEKGEMGHTCGKLVGAIVPFVDDYQLCTNTTLATVGEDGRVLIDVDTQFLETDRPLGTVLEFHRVFAKRADGGFDAPSTVSSVRASFVASDDFAKHIVNHLGAEGRELPINKSAPIGRALGPQHFKCVFNEEPSDEPHGTIMANILPTMPSIVTHSSPALAAAIANTQAEFETSYRSVSTSPTYRGRNLFYIAGINVDMSPTAEAASSHTPSFLRTSFIPWAAYYHTKDGRRALVEQDELYAKLESFAAETIEETLRREESLFGVHY